MKWKIKRIGVEEKKLEICSLPKPINGEYLAEKMKEIFNPLLSREEAQPIRIERVHRIRRPNGDRISKGYCYKIPKLCRKGPNMDQYE